MSKRRNKFNKGKNIRKENYDKINKFRQIIRNYKVVPNTLVFQISAPFEISSKKVKSNCKTYEELKELNKSFLPTWKEILNNPLWTEAQISEETGISINQCVKQAYEEGANLGLPFNLIHDSLFELGTPLSNKPGTIEKMIDEAGELLSTIVDQWDTFNRGEMSGLISSLGFHFSKINAMLNSLSYYFFSIDNWKIFETALTEIHALSSKVAKIEETFDKENELI